MYLDFAATAAIRPRSVIAAITEYLEGVGATPGRGGHRLAIAAERVALECRQALARLLGIHGDTARIVWTMNATHGLNTALSGVLGPGDVLAVTAFDHNAVLRCAYRLERERGVEVRLVHGRPDGTLDAAALDRALDGARLFSVNAASNVLGTTLDVRALCARAHAAGALAMVDTAQVAGELPFDAASSGADVVAVTGHKALLGPQGIGALWVRDGLAVAPLLVGGTGGNSMMREMPDSWPDHLQAGSVNAPGIAGLLAGIRWVTDRTLARIGSEAAALKARLREGLAAVRRVRVVSPPAPDGPPIVTIVAEDMDAGTLAGRLDREHGVMARPGLHCAPETHRLLGTDATGALRFSLGWASTGADVDRAIDAVSRVLAPSVFAGVNPREGGQP